MPKTTTPVYGAVDPGKREQLLRERAEVSPVDIRPNAWAVSVARSIFRRRISTFGNCVAIAVSTILVLLLGLVALLQNHGSPRWFIARSPKPLQDAVAPTILISLDGFRHEYLSRRKTRRDGTRTLLAPNLNRIAANGAYAVNGMQPVMPTQTRPCHWALATGLFAESGGIIENQMYDPVRQVWFKATREDPEWYSGSPIWQTIRNTPRVFLNTRGTPRSSENYTTACVGWPGCEVREYGANVVWKYDNNIPYEDRVIKVISLLSGTYPDLQKPVQFVTLYLKGVDDAGHLHGPNSPEVNKEIESVDSAVGFLLRALGDQACELYNVVIVSDHGMTEMVPEHTIDLTSSIKQGTVQDITRSPLGLFMNISVPAEHVYSEIKHGLKAQEGRASAYLKEYLPERWRLRRSRLITRVVTMADLGWTVKYPHQYILPQPHSMLPNTFKGNKGSHGFDNTFPDMQAIFLAQGPSFKPGSVVKRMRSVDIYEMLCYMFSATPGANNGTLQTTSSSILKSRP